MIPHTEYMYIFEGIYIIILIYMKVTHIFQISYKFNRQVIRI